MAAVLSKRPLLLGIGLFILYWLSARFGLAVSAINEFAALVWPPSGIAVAALILLGTRLWPAVFLGAFVVNFLTGASLLVALGIAAGNTLEAIIAAMLCSPEEDFRLSLERLQDVIRLILVAAFCTLISATIGVVSLWLGGVLENSQVLVSWMQWWAGDALAVMSITPLLLTVASGNGIRRLSWFNAGLIERLAFVVVFVSVSLIVLGSSPIVVVLTGFKGVYILVPILLWGAMRFGQRGAVLVTFTITMLAAWNTAHGYGPFVEDTFIFNLLHLFVFVVTMATTGMFVGAVVSERENERQRLELNDIELSAAKEAAEAANLAKSAFLANMSHEIRTPLGAVIGFSELVSDPSTEPKERIEFVEAIRRNGELLTILINDILDLAKIEAGKLEVVTREVFVADLVNDLKMAFLKQVREKGIVLEFLNDNSLPPVVSTDPLRLRQILINIIGNAIKFTPRGSVTVKIQTEKEKLVFIVKDTGIGIAPDYADKLFSPFSQVDVSSLRKHGGTGLGLALSRRLARLLGGDVVILDTVVGKGSTFLVSIRMM